MSYRKDSIKSPSFFRRPLQLSAQVIFWKFNKHPALFKCLPRLGASSLKRWRLIEKHLMKESTYLKLLAFYRRENKTKSPMSWTSFLYSKNKKFSIQPFFLCFNSSVKNCWIFSTIAYQELFPFKYILCRWRISLTTQDRLYVFVFQWF